MLAFKRYKAEKLRKRLKLAQSEKNYTLSLELLNEILAKTPDALDEIVLQTHLRALKGEVSLSEYRDTLAVIIPRLYNEPIQLLSTGKKVLRGIQYSFSGESRVERIEALLEATNLAIVAGGETADPLCIFRANMLLALGHYETFVDVVEKLAASKRAPKGLTALQKIAHRCQQASFPDYSVEKIFGIGLSRTATSSLNQALRKLGYDSIHWLNPNTQTVIGGDDFVLFEGFTDITVSYQFEALYDRFPNSRFIYTSRPKESWIRSVSSHYGNSRGINSPKELDLPNVAQRFDGGVAPAELNLYSRHATWEAAHDHFQDRVHQFFAARQETQTAQNNHNGRFLELKVTEGEGWEELCPFLGKAVPDRPFPNVNKRATQSQPAQSSKRST